MLLGADSIFGVLLSFETFQEYAIDINVHYAASLAE